MMLIHEFIHCLNCGEKLEVFTDDTQIDCDSCGYINEKEDHRLEFFYEEY